jgi:hypothetical protein
MKCISVTRNDSPVTYIQSITDFLGCVEGVFAEFDDLEVGTIYTIKIIDIPEETIDKLGEFGGW